MARILAAGALALLLALRATTMLAAEDGSPSLLELQRRYGEAESAIIIQKQRLEQSQQGIKSLDSLGTAIESFKFPAVTSVRSDAVKLLQANAKAEEYNRASERLFGAVWSDLQLLVDTLRKDLYSREQGMSGLPQLVSDVPELPNSVGREIDATVRPTMDSNVNPKERLAALTAAIDPSLLKTKVTDEVSKRRKTLVEAIEDATKQLGAHEVTRKELDTQLSKRQEGQLVIDQTLIKFVLPSFALLVVVLLLAPRLYRSEQIQQSIVDSGLLLELITVFLLTATTLVLGISGRIQGDILGTLLGGISGFVLGRARLRSASKLQVDKASDLQE